MLRYSRAFVKASFFVKELRITAVGLKFFEQNIVIARISL